MVEYNTSLERWKILAIEGLQLVKAVDPGYFSQNKSVILSIKLKVSVTKIDGDGDQR